MKKSNQKKLSLSRVKISSLSTHQQAMQVGGASAPQICITGDRSCLVSGCLVSYCMPCGTFKVSICVPCETLTVTITRP